MKLLDSSNDYNGELFIKVFGEDGAGLRNRMARKRRDAIERGLEFNLTMADIYMMSEKLMSRGNCDYSGLPLRKQSAADNNSIRYTPSIERIDDKKGYIRGNCCVVMQRVNQLKDVLWDKEVNTTLSSVDHEFIRPMMDTMTTDYLESLKNKYVPDFEFALTGDKVVKCHNPIDPQPSEEIVVLQGIGDHRVEIDNEELERHIAEAPKPKSSVPEDVAIAESYAGLLRYLAKTGKEITITFAHFKAAYKAKRCFITGKDLTSEMLPVIMDHAKPIEAGNLKFAEEKAANALNELCTVTNLSVADIVKNLKKVA